MIDLLLGLTTYPCYTNEQQELTKSSFVMIIEK